VGKAFLISKDSMGSGTINNACVDVIQIKMGVLSNGHVSFWLWFLLYVIKQQVFLKAIIGLKESAMGFMRRFLILW
jgi:hypothetical protein